MLAAIFVLLRESTVTVLIEVDHGVSGPSVGCTTRSPVAGAMMIIFGMRFVAGVT